MTMAQSHQIGNFLYVGHVGRLKATQKRIADMGGLSVTHPALAWARDKRRCDCGPAALGIFLSEFLVVSSTFARAPLLAIPLVVGLLLAIGALLVKVGGIVFGEPRGNTGLTRPPLFLRRPFGDRHCGRRLAAGPGGDLVSQYRTIVGRAVTILERCGAQAPTQESRPWPRAVVDARRLAFRGIATGKKGSGSFWRCGRKPTLCTRRSATCFRRKSQSSACRVHTGATPRSPNGIRPPCASTRTIREFVRLGADRIARRASLARSWPLGREAIRLALRRALRLSRPVYQFLPAEGEGLHQIGVGPVHAGIIEPGFFLFTANGETIVRLEERLGYVHKGIEGLMVDSDLDRAIQLRRPYIGRQHRRICLRLCGGRGRLRWRSNVPPRATCCVR